MVTGTAMKVIKICLRERAADTGWVEALDAHDCEIHVQSLDCKPYSRWMKSSGEMPWQTVTDIYCPSERVSALLGSCQAHCPTDTDIYVADVFRTYRAPVDGAEVITSCYLWNYDTPADVRKRIMAEHFEMEKLQVYYDYVVFQTSATAVTPKSPVFDFFFVSHVSDPQGIDTIYSAPALAGMREHSMAFLNTDTRLLSFGTTRIMGPSGR